MKTLLLGLLLASSASIAEDWQDIQDRRDFNRYRIEEQQRFEYEQDRLDRREYRERLRENQQKRYFGPNEYLGDDTDY